MILDSFRQDIRVGLRLLFKDKTFCFLAVLVLGLGIGGATTQFTIVNAIVLRGFSFALFIGILIGTYSSIFIAAPIVLDFDKKKSPEPVKKMVTT